MNQELYQAVLEYLNSQEVEQKLNSILDANFNDGQKKNFLKIWQQLKDLEFYINDLLAFLVFLTYNDFAKAKKIDDELFEQILIDVYDELQELHEEKSKQQESESNKNVIQIKRDNIEDYQDLTQKYNQFLQTSLFQNILENQKQIKDKYFVNNNLDVDNLRNEFYSAINSGDKIKVVGILRMICAQGKLKDFFKNDKRYKDFFSGYLVRHKGEKERDEFLQNLQSAKYIIEFLKFILNRRLDFSLEQSAMIGVGLAMLCLGTGEKEFSEMAYGDESLNKFMWVN